MDNFQIKKQIVAGDPCILKIPKLDFKWTKDNLWDRSAIRRESDGFVVSMGFPKFFNWHEKPELSDLPKNGEKIEAIEKRDGSLLIFSLYKGQKIFRTRNCFDATQHENENELKDFSELNTELFYNVAASFEDCEVDGQGTANFSILFEWESPTNIIVLDCKNPQLVLLGLVLNNEKKIATQLHLNELAEEFGLLRPCAFSFDSIETMVQEVPTWKDAEGIVIYHKEGQRLVKLKTEFYNNLHKLIPDLNRDAHIRKNLFKNKHRVSFFLSFDNPSAQTTFDALKTFCDFEYIEQIEQSVLTIEQDWLKFLLEISEGKTFVSKNKNKPRKELAEIIFKDFKRVSKVLFYQLDDRLEVLDIKKIFKDFYK